MAGTTWQPRSQPIGAVDDDQEPRTLLPGSQRRRRSRTMVSRRSSAPRLTSNGMSSGGSSGASSATASTRGASSGFSAASSTNLSQARAAGRVGERLLRKREVPPRAGSRVPVARHELPGGEGARSLVTCPTTSATISPSSRPPASGSAGSGPRPARLARGRATLSGSPSSRCSSRAPGLPEQYPLARFMIWATGERLPRWRDEPRRGRRQVARQGSPRSLRLAGHREGAPRS